MIGVGIDETVAQSHYGGEGGDGVREELLSRGVEEKGGGRTCVVWFKLGSIGPSEEAPDKSPVGRRYRIRETKRMTAS